MSSFKLSLASEQPERLCLIVKLCFNGRQQRGLFNSFDTLMLSISIFQQWQCFENQAVYHVENYSSFMDLDHKCVSNK